MKIRCPWCEHEFPPASELVLAGNVTVTVTCPVCGRRFTVTPAMQRLEE